VGPDATLPPATSNLNCQPGHTVANGVVAKVRPDGHVSIMSPLGPVKVVVDVAGYFAPAAG
jgi:hypothetical protein